MGRGEDVYDDFRRWFGSLTDEAAQAFEVMYPEPSGWGGFYRGVRDTL
jgi:hypothetical protein